MSTWVFNMWNQAVDQATLDELRHRQTIQADLTMKAHMQQAIQDAYYAGAIPEIANPESRTDTDFCFRDGAHICRVRQWTDMKLWIFMRESWGSWLSLRHLVDGELEKLRATALSAEDDDYYRHETHMKKIAA